MNQRLASVAKKLKSPVVTHVAAVSAGAIVVAVAHHQWMSTGRVLALSKDAFDALINEETNFVRFTSNQHEHARSV